jgi:hypothetical protein
MTCVEAARTGSDLNPASVAEVEIEATERISSVLRKVDPGGQLEIVWIHKLLCSRHARPIRRNDTDILAKSSV